MPLRSSDVLVAAASVLLLVGCGSDSALEPASGGPAVPSNVSAAAAASEPRITVGWQDNSLDESGFEVQRSTSGEAGAFSMRTAAGVNVTSYIDDGVVAGAQYCYRIRAARLNGTATLYSTFSNVACATANRRPEIALASVVAGGAHTCGLTSAGAAYCWGRAESGQLGVPVPATTCTTDAGTSPCSKVPVAVQGGVIFSQLAGGGAHTCGLTNDGSAYCWGSNASGQLGDNTTESRSAPTLVATNLKFARLDAGVQHTCGLTTAGKAYCWGLNSRGQLGDSTTTTRVVPVAVSGGLTFQAITAGGFIVGHTCALTTAGAAYCWGDNQSGQLGIGVRDLVAHPTPAAVTGGLTFTALTAGLGTHTCGLTSAGAAHCWGANAFGALGNASGEDSPVPVPVSGGHIFARIVAGGFIGHTCGLSTSGAAYCWGDNEIGAIGDGTTEDRFVPAAVAGGLTFGGSIDAGFRHTCARTLAGTIYCWGSNGAGQLGDDSNTGRQSPVRVFGQP